MARTVLRVDGMSCDHCVRSISKALESLEGVTKAEVSLEKHRAIVEHAEGKPSALQMIAAIQDEGYSASGE